MPRKRFVIPALAVMLLAAALLARGQAALAAPADTVDAKALARIIKESPAKVVLVNFWATWCPPCRMEQPGFIKVRREYSSEDVLILGVSVDQDAGAVERYVDEAGINYPVYLAAPDVGPSFRVTTIPKLMAFTKGKLALDHAGYAPEQGLRRVLDSLLAR